MRSWGEGFICLRELCRACGIYGIPNGIANSGWHGLVIRPAETGREIELTRTVTVIADQNVSANVSLGHPALLSADSTVIVDRYFAGGAYEK